MIRKLDVYLFSHKVGLLEQDPQGQLFFSYLEAWVDSPEALSLSLSLPLQKERFKQRECRPFFAGVLPEEGKRELIAGHFGISAKIAKLISLRARRITEGKVL